MLFDVVYDPWPTPLAAAWEKRGGAVTSGLDLLVHQAVGQLKLMTGHHVPARVLFAAIR
jgi:shikimate dehydrogenase